MDHSNCHVVSPKHRQRICISLFASALLIAAGIVLAAPGDLDPGFSGDGLLSVHIGDFAFTRSVIQQSDGKLVLAGGGGIGDTGHVDFIAVRVRTNGTPDSAFGINGIARADFFASYDEARAAIQQADGKVVLAGYAHVSDGIGDIALARFDTDGNLDLTFDGDGKVTLDAGGTNEYAVGLALQPDGKLVVAGQSNAGGTSRAFFARYDASGTLDMTFGDGGLAFADFGAGLEFSVTDVAQQSDGKLVAVGTLYGLDTQEMGIARVTADGMLDPSFDGDGLLTVDSDGGFADALSAAIQPDDKIIVLGYNGVPGDEAQNVLLRVNGNGSLDSSFGTAGKAVVDLGNRRYLISIIVLTDGRLAATGSGEFESGYDLIVARFSSDGVLDTSFGIDGVAIADFGDQDQTASIAGIALIQQTDGKLVAAGDRLVIVENGGAFSAARFDDNADFPGRIGLTATSKSVAEEDASVSYTVRRTGGRTGSVAVDFATADGGAVAGSDYESVTGTLTWGDGEVDEKTLTINLIDDSVPEGDFEGVLLSLTSPTGGAVLAASAATTFIQNADGPGVFSFNPFIYSMLGTEGESNIQVLVGRVSGSEGEVSVSYDIINSGNATLGQDFVVSGTLAWADGDTAPKFIDVDYLEDAVVEGTESFTIELTAPTGGATIRASDRRTIMFIIDNDDGFFLPNTAASVNENSGSLQIAVARSGASNGAASVDFATSDGTAVADSDYSAASGTLTWAAGDASAKTIEIAITNDQVGENSESFTVSLSNPTGGLALASNSTASVTIADDDAPPPPPPPPPRGGGGATGLEWLALLGLLKLFAPRVRQIRWLETRPGVP